MDIKVWSENAKNGTPILIVNKNGKEFRLKYKGWLQIKLYRNGTRALMIGVKNDLPI